MTNHLEDNMSFTRKHYEIIARNIKGSIADVAIAEEGSPERRVAKINAIEMVARSLALEFERDNPRFDRTRFLVACGHS